MTNCAIQIRNTPGIGVFITRNKVRGKKIPAIERSNTTKVIKEQGGLSRKDLLDIINDQSKQIIGLKQFIDDLKGERKYEAFRGNCDAPDTTIHKGEPKNIEKKVRRCCFKC